MAWTHEEDALAQRFDGAGAPLTQDVELSDDIVNVSGHPRIARGTGDTIVAAWAQIGDAYWRRFDAGLTPVAGRAPAREHKSGVQPASGVGVAADGRVVVGCKDDDAHYRRFNTDGNPITEELTANADTGGGQEFPDVAVQPDGDFAIAWTESNDGIEARFFTTP